MADATPAGTHPQGATTRDTELERAVRTLRATQEIAVALGGETDLERILELVVNRGRALVEARGLVILLVDGSELTAAASAGEVQGVSSEPFALEGTLFGEVLRRGRPERVADINARLRISPDRLGVPGASSAMLVPMLYRRQPVGLMVAFDHGSEDQFSSDNEQALQAFAASAAIAVAGAKTVASERLQATLAAAEEERRRWARELHDQTLQVLGGLRLQLTAARRKDELESWQAAGDEAIRQIESEILNLRAIITDLRPPALDHIGLAAAVAALAEHHESTDGLSVSCTLSPAEPVLGSELETTLYRLVQEALVNVVKHAHAQSAHVAIVADRDTVTVTVSDNGVGFDPAAASDGFGLGGVRERVALVNGKLTIDSGVRGTALTVTVPLAAATRGQAS